MCGSLGIMPGKHQDTRRRVLELRVARAGSAGAKPDPSGTVVVVQHPDGRLQVLNPSPMAGLSIRDRERLIVGLLEARSLRGDLDAARAWLQHRRWSREMASGRPAQRKELKVSGAVVVVDDLGRSAGELPARVIELPGQADPVKPPRAKLAGLMPAPSFQAPAGQADDDAGTGGAPDQ